ncbi:MAG: SDR family oxidoreductase, partial [Pseudomonadota bacterium]|nr:SDR family oxidoreductase [Pseudomonadota bacterium]
PGRVLGMQADVRDRAHVQKFVEKAISEYGGVDVVINNAHQPYEAKWFEDTSWDEYQREVDTIIKGSFNMVQLALPSLKLNGGGSIINIGSTMAVEPLMQHSFYVTAKNALIGFSRSLALELGQFGVRVNVVTPGPLDTEHNSELPRELMERLSQETPLHNRLGTCKEVANAVFLLALPESDLVTGSNVQVSGGFAIF